MAQQPEVMNILLVGIIPAISGPNPGGVQGRNDTKDTACRKDGVEAMEFLRQRGKYAEAPMPDIICLISTCHERRREVLADIKADEHLAIPVIIDNLR